MDARKAEPNPRPAAMSVGTYYARTPALTIDPAGTVADVNAACHELFGAGIDACKGRDFLEVERRLVGEGATGLFPAGGLTRRRRMAMQGDAGGGPSDGPFLLQTEEIRAVVAECTVATGPFGPARLRCCEMPILDPETGLCVGSSLGLEVAEMADVESFRRAVDLRLGHDLLWDVYAASYDRILTEMPFYLEVLDRHREALSPDAVGSVLDLGAGTGNLALQLLDLGKAVVAVDVGRAMLDRLRRKLGGSHAGRIVVVEGSAEELPGLADGSFDGVNILLALFDMADPARALAEAIRTLRPGGVLAVTEPRACFDVDRLMAFAEEALHARGVYESLAEDWTRIRAVAPLIHDVIADSEGHAAIKKGKTLHAEAILDRLRAEGFEHLTFRESHHGNCATITGTKPRPS
ncbi:Ubiquinone/menaquinone biosynthesis C-methyltransferase UbiE [Aquisphaera giovannonii]|uniref:Ubiquinone/menaquinone biosynthesis C-methyltransferase UbiE n=1 Tax=Aquisphaera giovannonii TaxID=406548 RepID=A0A5B9WEJ4_9BACT|nr:class I SAM-dependent methyltransferase [Aquisphaera giovannonii]QEH38893.1 Ubiquinone/menaquinone biosynthesis C-methyltransferase UbiE [Aquisphaera giovannonii]